MNTQKITKNNSPHFLEQYQCYVEAALDQWLPPVQTPPVHLHEAMRHAVFGGGKRIRPALIYAVGEMLNVERRVLNAPAVAVEMIHNYSLIHDDLPAMDDDDLRRGQPACHKVYDEATAILAGNSLQSLAFYVLTHDENMVVTDKQRLRMVNILAYASGSRGIAAGQATDLISVNKKLNANELKNIHTLKTATLIRTSVELGILSAPVEIEEDLFKKLLQYAQYIGLAFQIRDDILDIEDDTEMLGKHQGLDQTKNKPNYLELFGLDDANNLVEELYEKAVSSLSSSGDEAKPLKWIAKYITRRNY